MEDITDLVLIKPFGKEIDFFLGKTIYFLNRVFLILKLTKSDQIRVSQYVCFSTPFYDRSTNRTINQSDNQVIALCNQVIFCT